jgi:hypothetical protein
MSFPFVLGAMDLRRGTRRFQRFVTLRGAKPAGGQAPRPRGILDPDLLRSAVRHAFRKLDPRLLIRNPVMFVVEVTAALVTLIWIADVTGLQRSAGSSSGFQLQIGLWLWFTVLFATYAEAVAEARGRAQAATLRKTRAETIARRRRADGALESVGSSELRKGDVIVVEAGETIAADGDVIEGIGFVNEAAITGESAPVLKEPGTDIRSSVTGGTTLVSDRLVVRVTTNPGETFLDRMIALVEGAKRQRTPNEIALTILLSGMSLIFLMATVTLRPFGLYAGTRIETVALVALLVCLIPTTIGGLLSAIGIAGMDRGRGRDPARQDRHDHLRQPAGGSHHPGRGHRRGRGGDRGSAGVHQGRDAGRALGRGAGPAATGCAGPPRWHERRAGLRGPDRHDRRGNPLPGRNTRSASTATGPAACWG